MWMRDVSIVIIAALALSACDGRTVAAGDTGAKPDSSPGADFNIVDAATDRSFRPDRSVWDTGGVDAATFCSGGNKIRLNGKQLPINHIQAAPTMTSCCDGEQMKIQAGTGGGITKVTFAMLRFPGADKTVQTMNLASPPKGWSFFFQSEPPAACGYVNSSNSTFAGTLKREMLLGLPSVRVTVCARTAPKSGAPPEICPVEMYASKVMIKLSCTPGMDQTCNYDPMISSIKGKCNPDGSCTCNPGSKLMVTGKCQ